VFDVSEGARRLEAELRLEVTGTALDRGHSDANTDDAIAALGVLPTALTRQREREVSAWLGRSVLRFLRLRDIDEAILWTPIRMRPGENKPPVCPYCKTPNLRVADRSYIVMCFNPDCAGDSNGTRPAFARLQLHQRSGAAMLVWDDGLTETAREA
jgi:hypothetical protein